MADQKTLITKIAKAKSQLVLSHPFWGALAMNMQTQLVPADHPVIDTAATDGVNMFFNEEFLGDLTDAETLFVVAHEIGHPMFAHLTRRGARDPEKWNRAGDYVINRMLIEDGIGRMPSGGLDDLELHTAGEGLTDKIYQLLPDQKGGFAMKGDILESQQSEAEKRQVENEWRIKVTQAAQAAKMVGKLSAGVKRVIGDLLVSKVNWREVLQQFVIKIKDEQRTWARPNRRLAANGVYLPGRTGEAMGELIVAVDCSGSVGADELREFAIEIHTIKDEHKPLAVHVVYFDSRVCHYDRFDRDDDLVITPHGGGGTAFSPIFRYVRENGIDPVACVVLTDLYCSDFGDAPGYPVLWVTNGALVAPWGEVVKMSPRP